jgi:hypothetical protein
MTFIGESVSVSDSEHNPDSLAVRIERQADKTEARGLLDAAAGLRTRSSIVGYLEERAVRHEIKGNRGEATALRVEASNIAAQLDIQAGQDGIISAAQAIIRETVAAFGGVSAAEVTAPSKGSAAAVRVRYAAMWVAKKRLGWGADRLAGDFHRDPSTVTHGVQRADEFRGTDLEFRRITDNLVVAEIRCEHCLVALAPVAVGGTMAAG